MRQLSSLPRALRRRPPIGAAPKPHPFSSSPEPVPDAPAPAPMPTRPWKEALSAAQRAFCLPLAGRVLAAAGTGNAAVAPAAVHATLALAASGARGATRRQCSSLQALGCSDGGRGASADAANVASRVVKRVLKDRSTSAGPRLAFTGGVWADASARLSPEFVEAAGGVYGSAAKTANFKNKVYIIWPLRAKFAR